MSGKHVEFVREDTYLFFYDVVALVAVVADGIVPSRPTCPELPI
jgi:hypothetical protein